MKYIVEIANHSFGRYILFCSSKDLKAQVTTENGHKYYNGTIHQEFVWIDDGNIDDTTNSLYDVDQDKVFDTIKEATLSLVKQLKENNLMLKDRIIIRDALLHAKGGNL